MYSYYNDNNGDYNGYIPGGQYFPNPFFAQQNYRFPNPMEFYPPFPFCMNKNNTRSAEEVKDEPKTQAQQDQVEVNKEEVAKKVEQVEVKKEERIDSLNMMNQNILNLNNQMRKIWLEHVFYINSALMSILYNLDNKTIAFRNLTQNAIDLENLFAKYYSQDISNRIGNLFRNHILITLDMFNAIKRNDARTLANLENELSKNSQEFANFLASINPNYDRVRLNDMFRRHESDLKNLAILTRDKKYEQANDLFNQIKSQALDMADMLTDGIIKAFPNQF